MVRMIPAVLIALIATACDREIDTNPQQSITPESDTVVEPVAPVVQPYDYTQTKVPPEPLRGIELGDAKPHWVWVMDPMLNAMPDGRAYLIDGDEGRFLGMLNTGFSFVSLSLPPAYDWIYSAETYFSRHTRGDRIDVVSVYDRHSLAPVEEIIIPTKRASTIPRPSNAAVTDDGRFMAVFNFTPAPSVSILNLVDRAFVGEVQIPGCAMVYATGPRQFFSLCGDGRVAVVDLDDSGAVASRFQSDPFFSLDDPITEFGVRYADSWIFASADGVAHQVRVGQDSVAVETWSLVEQSDSPARWWVGGLQHLAVHEARGELFSVMHQADARDYELPGDEVWVYDIATQTKTRTIKLKQATASIIVTQDAEPLMFGVPLRNELDIYNAVRGSHNTTMTEIGLTPMLMATPIGANR